MKNLKNTYSQFCLLLVILFPFVSNFGQGAYSVFENDAQYSIDSDAELLGEFDNRLLYFDVESDIFKLWASDGTPNGTIKISTENQTSLNFIVATTDAWYFQETVDGMHHISELTVGSDVLTPIYTASKSISKIIYWQNDFFYVQGSINGGFADDDLIKVNPATGDMEVLFTSDFGGIRGIGATGTDVYFVTSMDDGKMLGKTDGTPMNTATFAQLYESGSEFGQNVFMEAVGDKMYFFYHPSNDPYNLWVSDGTESGTEILKEFDAPSFGTPDGAFKSFNDQLFFIMREADAPSGTTFDLHTTDGTSDETINLKGSASGYMHPRQLTVYNNQLFYTSLGNNWALESTDGTVAGTEVIISEYGYQFPGGIGGVYDIGTFNDSLVLQARGYGIGSELFISDGTLDGTRLLTNIAEGEDNSYPKDFEQVGNLLFFSAELNNIRQLWIYNPNLVNLCESLALENTILTPSGPQTIGTIEVEISGGTPPYTYQIVGGATSDEPIITDLESGDYTMIVTDSENCTIEFDFIIEIVMSVFNEEKISHFNVYPNPLDRNGIINLNFQPVNSANSVTISMQNLLGESVYQNNLSNINSQRKEQISVSNLSSGIYNLSVFIDGQLSARQMVIIK